MTSEQDPGPGAGSVCFGDLFLGSEGQRVGNNGKIIVLCV